MDTVKVGAMIARLRKERGMTQKELADALGISNKPSPNGNGAGAVPTCRYGRSCPPCWGRICPV